MSQGHHLGVIRKGFISKVCMPNTSKKYVSLMVQKCMANGVFFLPLGYFLPQSHRQTLNDMHRVQFQGIKGGGVEGGGSIEFSFPCAQRPRHLSPEKDEFKPKFPNMTPFLAILNEREGTWWCWRPWRACWFRQMLRLSCQKEKRSRCFYNSTI